MCRSIVVSPRAHSKFPKVSENKRPWHLSPLVGANLGNLGLVQRSPVSVSPEVQDLIRKLSESVKKQGILSRFSDKESSSSRGSIRKGNIRNQNSHLLGRKEIIVWECSHRLHLTFSRALRKQMSVSHH
jgi:hypothetical protein